ncbi:MAG: GAF domain-containing protein [Rhodothermales bacterium]|nr:GAF domain-containing protein [Rhodothermales bacterium]
MATPRHTAFPFTSVLSFRHLVNFWREVAADTASPRSIVARTILDRLGDEAAELEAPIQDLALLDDHRDLVDLMMGAIFPPALWEQALMAVTAPFNMQPVYATPSFEALNLIEEGEPQFPVEYGPHGEGMAVARTMHAYYWILKACYGIDKPDSYPLIFGRTDPETRLDTYYKLDINARFASIECNGDLPELSDDKVEELLSEPLNVALWKKTLPPDLFEFHGLIVLSATNVTDQVVISNLKDDLLKPDAMTSPDGVKELERRLRALLRQPDLELGLICLLRDDIEGITTAQSVGRSLLLGDAGAPACPYKADSYYARAYESNEPIVVGDLAATDILTGFEKHLRDQDFRTLVLAPLRVKGKIIGILELASPTAHAVNVRASVKLAQAVSLFASAMKRMLDEREDRVQAIIKQHYTAIHPSVEWRFRKAAQRLIDQSAQGLKPSIDPVFFPNVYPLYGLTDIRGSSSQRSDAIQEDLLEQLGMALGVIVEASIARPLPILDEISYRISQYADRMGPDTSTEDETSVLEFLQEDVEPLLERLADFGPKVRERVEAYRDALDPELGVLYRKRRDYETSVTLVNETISAYLDRREDQAQQMFPHYFEKFKTDGVDYNIYVGASLVEDGAFDPLYLHNLRLWQLLTTCGIEWELRRLYPELPTPMEATHLILVQSTPLSVRFRLDEKQFDVDGAYNIRYAIVKKRIDKAVIKGTDERLTQPGKIAVVYSQAREAAEYRRYLDYLRAAGFIEDEIEALELEPMQGVHGLKALRVTVRDEEPTSSVEMEPRHMQIVREVLEEAAS